MAIFTVTIAEGFTDAQLISMLQTWASSLNGGLKVGDNFDGTFTAGVANIADAADIKGFTMTGNITMPAGGTVDGVDISSLKDTVDSLNSVVTNNVITKDNMIFLTGSCSPETDLYGIFTAAYPDYSTTTHNIKYACIGFQILPITYSDYDGYTAGDVYGYMSGSTAKIGGQDRDGNTVKSTSCTFYYLIIATPV